MPLSHGYMVGSVPQMAVVLLVSFSLASSDFGCVKWGRKQGDWFLVLLHGKIKGE